MNESMLTRRSVLLSGASLLGIWKTGLNPLRAVSDESALHLTETQRLSLADALKKADEQYDPAAKMLAVPFSSVGYHSTLSGGTVHPTRTSLEYAVALLDSGEAERLERAKDILKTVVALQDQDPTHKTYGIWSWYLEEPLEKMAPPDWNWADFCGVQLLAAIIDHRQRLDGDLAKLVQDSIIHAAYSIQRRNVDLGYTNIAIMGTYVTLVAAEQFVLPDLQKYARDRLRRFYKYLNTQGSFHEYNSPTYTLVAIKELTRMLMHVRDANDKQLIQYIHDYAWKHATCRFHSPTRQWAGPHSRCYNTLLSKETAHILEYASGEKNLVTSERPLLLGLSSYRLAFHCPEIDLNAFAPIQEARNVTEMFIKTPTPEHSTIGYTYLHPAFTLGSVNFADLWNQRRPFVAYWGTPDKPAYIQLRFLHNGYDFCSAIPFVVQDDGCALVAVVFATDYGDTHPTLDRVKDSKIRAKDLRLRIEFGGAVNELIFIPFSGDEGMLFLKDRTTQMQIRPIADPFGQGRCSWEIGQNDKSKWIDAVAYSGEEKEIDINQLEKAYIVFAFQICTTEEKPAPFTAIESKEENGKVQIIWKFMKQEKSADNDNKNKTAVRFHIELPIRPNTFKNLSEGYKNLSMQVGE